MHVATLFISFITFYLDLREREIVWKMMGAN